MGSPNSPLDSERLDLFPKNLSIADMERNEVPEEQELARKAIRVLQAIVQELKPILGYVASPNSFSSEGCAGTGCAELHKEHALEIGIIHAAGEGKRILFLGKNGRFFSAQLCELGPRHFHYKVMDDDTKAFPTHKHYPFERLLRSLQEILKAALEKREKHLASIKERSTMLDRIMEILEKPVS